MRGLSAECRPGRRGIMGGMRILHLSDRLSERGGAYQHLLAVVEAQVAEGHEVDAGGGPRGRRRQRDPCPVRLRAAGLDARTSSRRRDRRGPHELQARRDPPAHGGQPGGPALGRPAGAVITVQDHRYFCPGRGKWTLARRVAAASRCPWTPARTCFEDEAYFREVLGAHPRAPGRRCGPCVWSCCRATCATSCRRPGSTARASRGAAVRAPAGAPAARRRSPRACSSWAAWSRARARSKRPRPGAAPAWTFRSWSRARARCGRISSAAGAEVLGWVDRGALASLYRARAASW